MNREYLAAIVNTFVLPSRRARLLALSSSKRRYADFLHDLLHDPRYLDPRVIVELADNERLSAHVLARLRALGAGAEGYLVGDCGDFEDGRVAALPELLEVCVGSMQDALVYCPGSRVAYYEGHEGFGYILRQAPNGRLPRTLRASLPLGQPPPSGTPPAQSPPPTPLNAWDWLPLPGVRRRS